MLWEHLMSKLSRTVRRLLNGCVIVDIDHVGEITT